MKQFWRSRSLNYPPSLINFTAWRKSMQLSLSMDPTWVVGTFITAPLCWYPLILHLSSCITLPAWWWMFNIPVTMRAVQSPTLKLFTLNAQRYRRSVVLSRAAHEFLFSIIVLLTCILISKLIKYARNSRRVGACFVRWPVGYLVQILKMKGQYRPLELNPVRPNPKKKNPCQSYKAGLANFFQHLFWLLFFIY